MFGFQRQSPPLRGAKRRCWESRAWIATTSKRLLCTLSSLLRATCGPRAHEYAQADTPCGRRQKRLKRRNQPTFDPFRSCEQAPASLGRLSREDDILVPAAQIKAVSRP